MAGTVRPQQAVERAYISDYVLKAYPKKTRHKQNCPMGPVPPELQAHADRHGLKSIRRWRNYADAVVILGREVHVIEGKVWHPSTAIGDLLCYMEEFDATPELQEFRQYRRSFLLVAPYFRPVWLKVCRRVGIRPVEFQTDAALAALKRKGML